MNTRKDHKGGQVPEWPNVMGEKGLVALLKELR